jgi:hypothetical protein
MYKFQLGPPREGQNMLVKMLVNLHLKQYECMPHAFWPKENHPSSQTITLLGTFNINWHLILI